MLKMMVASAALVMVLLAVSCVAGGALAYEEWQGRKRKGRR
jgi:hypothetical protein